jgi:putative FmdB family regulatory protein
MPIYEYLCEDCGTKFDSLRSMKEADTPIACKKCNSEHTHRKVSVFFAQSDGRSIASNSGCGCGNCSGGSCASCRN